ncbi:hypothetical protein SUDANB43_00119 [Streptomyces sp. enrichment culture]
MNFGLPDGLTAGYRAAMPHAPVLDVYLAVYGDLIFGAYSNRLAELHARAGGRAFLSRFDRRRADARAAVRAWHCADVPFAFGNLDDERPSFLIGGAPTPADRTPARRMVRAWADFAATGSPGRSPVRDSATEVRTWTTGGHADPRDQPTADLRALWAKAEFPLPRP